MKFTFVNRSGCLVSKGKWCVCLCGGGGLGDRSQHSHTALFNTTNRSSCERDPGGVGVHARWSASVQEHMEDVLLSVLQPTGGHLAS